jgi:hypothetical protein
MIENPPQSVKGMLLDVRVRILQQIHPEFDEVLELDVLLRLENARGQHKLEQQIGREGRKDEGRSRRVLTG